MTSVCLILLSLAAAPPADVPDVADLVAKLTSPRTSERAAAEARLAALGEVAMPALREARESPDLERRMRAAALMDAIDGGALVRPSVVRLDFRERTIAEVVEALAERTGRQLALEPENDPRWKARRITLVADEPVTFWKAIDALSKAAGLRPGSAVETWNARRRFNGMGQARRRALTGQELLLRPDDPSPAAPTFDSGAFRFSLTALRLDRFRDFVQAARGVGGPADSARFSVQFSVQPEPGVQLARVGEVRVIEAVDDRGNSLQEAGPAPPPSGPPGPGMVWQNGNVNGNAPSGVMSVPLTYPDGTAKSLARLRGTVRLTVVGRRRDSLVIPLPAKDRGPEAVGRSGEVSLTIHSVKTGPNGRGTTVDLTLTSPDEVGQNFGYDPRAILRPPPTARGQITFVDARGRTCLVVDLNGNAAGQGQRSQFWIDAPEGTGPPEEARYSGATWATIDVPFSFANVPMP